MDEQQKRLAEELLFSEKKKPSFAKQLYFGLFDESQVFPYPKASPDEKEKTDALVAQLNQFADEQIDPVAIDRNAAIPDSVIQGLGRLGILGLTVPQQYDGLGMSQYAYCRVAETIASRCAATALFLNAHQSIGLKALLLFGTEEQRNRHLKPLASGEHLAAFALTEPNAGSDASGVETRAVYDPEKNVYRINGRKQWITNGSIAKVLTVMAQTEMDTPKGPQDRITAFLVTPDMPGFKVLDPSLEKVGMRGSKTANLMFENVEVPAENILGPKGGGLKVCLTVLDYGRTTFGATCTGAAKAVLRKSIDHAIHRYQFKRPLASFPLVKKKIATMSALVYAMDAMTYMTAGFVDSKTEDFMLEAAMLKVFTSDSLWTILYDSMQILGGRSFFTNEPYERMMRDARLNMIGEGANEVLRAFIGVVGMRDVGVNLKETLDALKDPFREFETLWGFARKNYWRLWSRKVPLNSPLLQEEAKRLGQAVQTFGIAIARVLATYREDILEKQLLLDRVATGAMAIYSTTCVLSKLDSDFNRVQCNTSELGNDLAIGKLYCRLAMDNFKQCMNGLFENNDEEIESLSDQITGVRVS